MCAHLRTVCKIPKTVRSCLIYLASYTHSGENSADVEVADLMQAAGVTYP